MASDKPEYDRQTRYDGSVVLVKNNFYHITFAKL